MIYQLQQNMNYVIATYAGTSNEFSLELQMQNLFAILMNKKTKYIKQVTIVCPPVKPEHSYKTCYYNWDKWINLFQTSLPHISLVYMDYVGENRHASYDQWIQAIQRFPDFEYYLLIEDDYCIHPSILDFDTKIIDTYNQIVGENNIGYVCTYADAIMGKPYHAAISNGIVNKKTIEKFKDIDILKTYYECADECGIEQVAFSNLFLQYDIPVYSFHEIYTAVFWSSFRKCLELYSQDIKNYMFIPIQFLLHQI